MPFKLVGEIGLKFFGKISASISHEIKNIMAIINENAGLIEDLTLMSEKGIPIDPERLKNISAKIIKQVARADTILKNMNKFAHSIDEPFGQIELGELISLVCGLSARFASMKGVNVEVNNIKTPIIIITNPFFMQTIIFRCINFTMDNCEKGKTVFITSKDNGNSATIAFGKLREFFESKENLNFPQKEEKILLNALKSEMILSLDTKELILNIPKDINK
ncbi:MAG: HAMP domain-containing histidine kinase [Desulfobacterales bacterium]|nr:HAMP domain-containing histidine kinase [Desulfobacterales bacterium]MBF0395810.1 HAMP domain-containing histidine kinase [Desulfobacterales bacterium]